jgi:hypothetical protein
MIDNDFIVNIDDKDFNNKLEFAMLASIGSSAYRNDRDRPYPKQITVSGGKQKCAD